MLLETFGVNILDNGLLKKTLIYLFFFYRRLTG